MIDIKEELQIWQDKRQFIETINKAFQLKLYGVPAVKVSYEVYEKAYKDYNDYSEWVIVTFKNGAISPLLATANSNAANLRLFANAVDGGCYQYMQMYNRLKEDSWKQIL